MKLYKTKKIVDADAEVGFLSLIFASGLYTGFMPFASGTFGSIFGSLFFFLKDFQRAEILIPSIVICALISIPASKEVMKKYGDDPSVIVIDEVIGMWISVLVFQFFNGISSDLNFKNLIIVFLCFRLFDIIKIQPSKYFDDMKSATGVILDDVIAGIYAGVAAYLITLVIAKL